MNIVRADFVFYSFGVLFKIVRENKIFDQNMVKCFYQNTFVDYRDIGGRQTNSLQKPIYQKQEHINFNFHLKTNVAKNFD